MDFSSLTLAPGWQAHLGADLTAAHRRPSLGDLGSVAETSLLELGDRRFLREPSGNWLSGRQFLDRSRAGASALLAAGVRPGDRVVLVGQNSADFAAVAVGVFLAGAVLVAANPAYTDRELAHVVKDSRPAAMVCDAELLERAEAIAAAASGALPIEGPGSDLPLPQGAIQILSIRQAVAHEGEWTAGSLAAGRSWPAMVAYTSGTTGAPKGALLTHMHGLGVGLIGSLLMGSSIVLFSRFDPAPLAAAVAGEGATMFFGVPAMYRRLVSEPACADFARLRLLVSGSAPLPPDLFDQIRSLVGAAPLERYGMSETAMNVSNPYEGPRKAGTVGLPLPGVEVALDSKGEILVRGENVFSGYLGNPGATAERFDDGWFRTGDLGSFDSDGYLRIEGRSSDLIISGGFNVYPREVEEQLRSHSAVADAAVVGVPSQRWGEEVVAFVVPTAGAEVDADSLRTHAAERLAPYKVPKRIIPIDALPRNAMGKVLAFELRRQAGGA
ncbi:MAG: AMP-binding protein [Actinomycetota bacterium]|nr:AMP-binding protein [Actinomycetota bacterium]